MTVTNTGVGMGPGLLASLFDDNARTSRPGTESERGTGMGGKGTSFSFVLPVSSPPPG